MLAVSPPAAPSLHPSGRCPQSHRTPADSRARMPGFCLRSPQRSEGLRSLRVRRSAPSQRDQPPTRRTRRPLQTRNARAANNYVSGAVAVPSDIVVTAVASGVEGSNRESRAGARVRAWLSAPQVLEPSRCQLGVAHRATGSSDGRDTPAASGCRCLCSPGHTPQRGAACADGP